MATSLPISPALLQSLETALEVAHKNIPPTMLDMTVRKLFSARLSDLDFTSTTGILFSLDLFPLVSLASTE
jgi:hypothetical protein